jgi:hypothetical protein
LSKLAVGAPAFMRGKERFSAPGRVSTLITRFSAGNARPSCVPCVREPQKRPSPRPGGPVPDVSPARKGWVAVEVDPERHRCATRSPTPTCFARIGRGARLSNKINPTESTIPLIWTALTFSRPFGTWLSPHHVTRRLRPALLRGRIGLWFVVQRVNDLAWLGVTENDPRLVFDGIGV